MKKVIIIGNGLFGCIAAAAARARGHEVAVVSDQREFAASPASGCVLAPSWLSSLSAAQVSTGMQLLNELYRVEDVKFSTLLGLPFKAKRIDPDSILRMPDFLCSVLRVKDNGVHLMGGKVLKADVILVAAGVWSGELVETPPIRGLYGASVRFKAHLPHPQIHVYAPYRQAVGFQLNKREVWFGDGTALIKSTWEKEWRDRVAKTIARGSQMLGGDVGVAIPTFKPSTIRIGARPYVEGHKAGYFRKVAPRVWVSTGGAKNGTVLAAAQAVQFLEEAKL